MKHAGEHEEQGHPTSTTNRQVAPSARAPDELGVNLATFLAKLVPVCCLPPPAQGMLPQHPHQPKPSPTVTVDIT